MCAYNLTCAGTDWATAGRPRVKPGDTILVHAGVYKYNRLEYTNDPAVNRTVPLDGTYYLTADGTAETPIVIKGAGDGEAIFDGAGNFALFDVKAADYTYFEGLTFRETDIAHLGGHAVHRRVERADGEAKPIRGRRRRHLHELFGLQQLLHRRQHVHRPRRSRTTSLAGTATSGRQFNGVDGQKFPPVMASYVAVKVYGPGHVVAYNYVANFHDGIDVETYGNPDGSAADDGPEYPPKEYWDRAAGVDRLLQQLHDQLSRQPVRDRRQHAQHPGDAEHDDQLRLARVLQPAGDRRAGRTGSATSPITCPAGRPG